MSIEKKSLISTLKTTKKANVAKEELGVGAASKAVNSPSHMKLTPSKTRLTPSKTRLTPSKTRLTPSVKAF